MLVVNNKLPLPIYCKYVKRGGRSEQVSVSLLNPGCHIQTDFEVKSGETWELYIEMDYKGSRTRITQEDKPDFRYDPATGRSEVINVESEDIEHPGLRVACGLRTPYNPNSYMRHLFR